MKAKENREEKEKLIREIDSLNMDIVVLAQTKKNGKGVEKKGKYMHKFSAVLKQERPKRGVVVLIKEKYGRYVGNYERIITVNIKLRSKTLLI